MALKSDSEMQRTDEAELYYSEIGHVNDDLQQIKGLSGTRDMKANSFLQRTHLGLLVRTHSLMAVYLRGVVRRVLSIRPVHVLLPGEELKFTVADVMDAASLSALQEFVSGEVYRRMESRFKRQSGVELVYEIIRSLDRTMTGSWRKVRQGEVEPYFALRHLIVHNHGRFDQDFVSRFNAGKRIWGSASAGDSIPGKSNLVRASVSAFSSVVNFVDPILLRALSTSRAVE